MSELKIVTDNKRRAMVTYNDLLAKVRADFDYIEDDDEKWSERFVAYKGNYYDMNDTARLDGQELLSQNGHWHGYDAHTAWSGVVFRMVWQDGEMWVICGSYTS